MSTTRCNCVLGTLAVLGVIVGACSGPDLNIPAPWEAVEGPGAEAASPRIEPAPPGWSRIGSSVRGKPIVAADFGSGGPRVYVIGGVSGDEPEGPAAAERLRDELFKASPEGATIRVVRDLNPDGTATHSKTNTRGVDLSRNWPARDYVADPRTGGRPASEIETLAVQKDLTLFKPDVVVVLRSSARGPVVSMDGPGPLLAAAFGSAARDIDPRWRAMPERRHTAAGSIESYVAGELGRPVLMVEFQRGRDASTNAAAARAGILAAAAKAKTPPASAAAPEAQASH